MMRKSILLPLILAVSLPCLADLTVLSEASLASDLDPLGPLQPEFAAGLGWETSSFFTEQWGLFFDSLAKLKYNTETAEFTGKLDLKSDLSYRTESFFARLGVSGYFWAETDDVLYLDLVPELYVSLGGADFQVFSSQKLTVLPVDFQYDFYEARLGAAFTAGTLVNKPALGLGMDLNETGLPLYLIAEYDLTWYPDPFLSMEFSTGVNWYFSGNLNVEYFGELTAFWYICSNLILNLSCTLDVTDSKLFPQAEVLLGSKAELGITLSENSIFSVVAEGSIYVLASYLEEPSSMKFLIRYSYLF